MDEEYVSDFDEQTDAVRRGLLTYEGTHCVHGTFVGNWAGPDYMCHYCELGLTDEEYAAEMEERRAYLEEQRKVRAEWKALVALGSIDEIRTWIESGKVRYL